MKNFSRRTLTIMATLLFACSAFLGARPAHAQLTTHAIITCQSASMKSSPSWNSATISTLYYGRKVGHHSYNSGFYLILDYGSNTWGYVYYGCVGGFNSW